MGDIFNICNENKFGVRFKNVCWIHNKWHHRTTVSRQCFYQQFYTLIVDCFHHLVRGKSSLIARYSMSGHSCLAAESLLNGKNEPCLYILAITLPKWKAKARIAEWAQQTLTVWCKTL
jgi:hypothetical protein